MLPPSLKDNRSALEFESEGACSWRAGLEAGSALLLDRALDAPHCPPRAPEPRPFEARSWHMVPLTRLGVKSRLGERERGTKTPRPAPL